MPEYLRLVPPQEAAPPKQTKIVGIDRPVKQAMRELDRLNRLENRAANSSDLEDIQRMNEMRRIRGYVDTMAWTQAILNELNLDFNLNPDPAS